MVFDTVATALYQLGGLFGLTEAAGAGDGGGGLTTVPKQIKDEEERIKEDEKESKSIRNAEKKAAKHWEESRDKRVSETRGRGVCSGVARPCERHSWYIPRCSP